MNASRPRSRSPAKARGQAAVPVPLAAVDAVPATSAVIAAATATRLTQPTLEQPREPSNSH